MSGLGADIFGKSLCNLARGSDMSGLTGVFGSRIDFLMIYTAPTHPMYPP
jgi:hypothetical protein